MRKIYNIELAGEEDVQIYEGDSEAMVYVWANVDHGSFHEDGRNVEDCLDALAKRFELLATRLTRLANERRAKNE